VQIVPNDVRVGGTVPSMLQRIVGLSDSQFVRYSPI
jgi:hypothetical protein